MINISLPPFKLSIKLSFDGDSRHCFLFSKLTWICITSHFGGKSITTAETKSDYPEIAKSASVSNLSAVKWLEVYGTSLFVT